MRVTKFLTVNQSASPFPYGKCLSQELLTLTQIGYLHSFALLGIVNRNCRRAAERLAGTHCTCRTQYE